MEISRDHHYLVVQREHSSAKQSVYLTESLPDVIRAWKSTTRIAPVFQVTGFSASSKGPAPTALSDGRIAFLGPIHPARVFECYTGDSMWIGFGILNVFLSDVSETDARRLKRWAKGEGISIEIWRVKDGQVIDVQGSTLTPPTDDYWLTGLNPLFQLERGLAPELSEAIKEYLPLIASAITGAGTYLPSFVSLCSEVSNKVVEVITSSKQPGGPSTYAALGQQISINAALSRLVAQTFSGCYPIAENRCNIKAHSLLGLGTAVIGVRSIIKFLEGTLGKYRIPERFVHFERQTDYPRLQTLPQEDTFWFNDYLASVPLKDGAPQGIPPIFYFSARDGYHGVLTTISAPLAASHSCNSPRWSLLTLTHEITHITIRLVLAELYPNLECDSERSRAYSLAVKQGRTRNFLDEIRKYLFHTIAAMDAPPTLTKGSNLPHYDVDDFADALVRWKHEVEEIIVHVIDFLYFYGGDWDWYVRAIWTSWGVIPSLASRVKGYVVRTMCAVLATNLRRGKLAEETTKTQVYKCLSDLAEHELGGAYTKDAIEYIDRHWESDLKALIVVRKGLVQLARAFLYSERLASDIRGEADRAGISIKPRQLDYQQIRNPLLFLAEHTRSSTPSMADSVWMYHVLAFLINEHG